ncbi:hypothetical protein OC834_006052 [Tilletia horrida]|uniref:Uncharacterized protein n=1 Tax=Tilletia horrida TaxID=155126 RepID=A0AAN6JLC6_9BASI|nr:hypothetical protein OC834_006052 [Tilletia horrida]KAK0524598.1 hypothetical protein OC835_005870 [Tilletia horrida]KAK0535111.1 hypothetical protein OC842_002413 [Tilletia horrida]
MSASKTTKWCTFLALCADAIMAHKSSRGHLHTFTADIFDSTGNSFDLDINQWSRIKPEDGLYILNNVPFATSLPSGRRIAEIDEPNSSRAVPSQIDGTDPDMPHLHQTDASFNGIGVTSWRSDDKKSCRIKGFTYINRDIGWVPWETLLAFPSTTRYENWSCHDVGSLVAFDAIVSEQEDEQPLKGTIRRLAFIADAPKNLQHSLGIGNAGGDAQDRRAKLLSLHQKRARDNGSSSSSSGCSSASRSEIGAASSSPSPGQAGVNDTSPTLEADFNFSTPSNMVSDDNVTSGKGKGKAIELQAPESPTIAVAALRVSKRHKQE